MNQVSNADLRFELNFLNESKISKTSSPGSIHPASIKENSVDMDFDSTSSYNPIERTISASSDSVYAKWECSELQKQCKLEEKRNNVYTGAYVCMMRLEHH